MKAWFLAYTGRSAHPPEPFLAVIWLPGRAKVAMIGQHEAAAAQTVPHIWQAYFKSRRADPGNAWILHEWSAWADSLEGVASEGELEREIARVERSAPEMVVTKAEVSDVVDAVPSAVAAARALAEGSRHPMERLSALLLDQLCRELPLTIHVNAEVEVAGYRMRPDLIIEVNKESPSRMLIVAEATESPRNVRYAAMSVVAARAALQNRDDRARLKGILLTQGAKTPSQVQGEGITVIDPWGDRALDALRSSLAG